MSYLNLEHEIVASKSKSDDSKSIQSVEGPFQVGIGLHRIVGDAGQSALHDGDHPYQTAVADGGDGSDQRHAGNGVQVGELGQQHGGAGENQVPLDGRQVIGVAVTPTHDLEEGLGG